MVSRALMSLLMIGVVAAVAGAGTLAYFSDTETSTGNTLTAGKLDLKVNGHDDPNVGRVVVISDLKPSIPQYATVTLTIIDNPGQLWKYIGSNTPNGGVLTEPETEEEGTTPNDDLFPSTYFDLKVNGVVLIPDNTYTLSQVSGCWMPLGTFGVAGQPTDVTVEQSFHLASRVTNWAQGDIATFDEKFAVTQVNNPTPPGTVCAVTIPVV